MKPNNYKGVLNIFPNKIHILQNLSTGTVFFPYFFHITSIEADWNVSDLFTGFELILLIYVDADKYRELVQNPTTVL